MTREMAPALVARYALRYPGLRYLVQCWQGGWDPFVQSGDGAVWQITRASVGP
jgi:hypothetical protein